MNNFPDFLGIGAQKSGTTWLWANMLMHPNIYLPPNKEIHFFDLHFEEGLDWYSSLFHNVDQKVKGEITPYYSILPKERIALIKKINPNMKIIFILRNPIDRAWSHAIMELSTLVGKPLHEVQEEEFLHHFSSPKSLAIGNYPNAIRTWSRFFPKQQFFIGNFDQIQTNPEALLNDEFFIPRLFANSFIT